VDFRNVILIMTSNAGAAELAKSPIGFGRKREVGDDEEAIDALLRSHFTEGKKVMIKRGRRTIYEYQMSLPVAIVSRSLPDRDLWYDPNTELIVFGYETNILMLIARYGSDSLFEAVESWVITHYSNSGEKLSVLQTVRDQKLNVFGYGEMRTVNLRHKSRISLGKLKDGFFVRGSSLDQFTLIREGNLLPGIAIEGGEMSGMLHQHKRVITAVKGGRI